MITIAGDGFYLAQLLSEHASRWEMFLVLDDAKDWVRAGEAVTGLSGLDGRIWRVSRHEFTGALIGEEVFELVSAETVR